MLKKSLTEPTLLEMERLSCDNPPIWSMPCCGKMLIQEEFFTRIAAHLFLTAGGHSFNESGKR